MLAKLNIKSKAIGDYTYYVRPFPPLDALRLLGDLQAVVTSSLGGAVSTDDAGAESVLDRKVDVASMIAGLGGKLTGNVLVGFADRILDGDYVSVQMKGEDTPTRLDANIVNSIFGGHVKNMLELMWFVLEVNYADFFESAPNLSGILTKLAQK